MKIQVGDIVGNNLVLEKDEYKTEQTKRTYWKVKCLLCNNIRSIRNDNIHQKCRSCAAKNRTDNRIIDDLTNRIFGYWKVLYKTNIPNYWHCKCLNCGTEKDVFRGNLTQGASKSCGCINSWGETQISFLLQKNNINYKKEYTFPDLKTEKGGTPRFDFAIFKEDKLFCLIEYDGRQHSNFDENWKMSFNDFKHLQNIDKLKEEYCKNHNITLIRLNKNSNLEQIISDISK